MGFKEEADLDAAIKTTDAAIRRARNKELGIEEEEKVSIEEFVPCWSFGFATSESRKCHCGQQLVKALMINVMTIWCVHTTKIGTPYFPLGGYSRRGTFRTGSEREEEAAVAQGQS